MPVMVRRVIKKHDDRADKWVRISLSWFGVARLLELAPRVRRATFQSIVTPSKDIYSVAHIFHNLFIAGMTSQAYY